jgi:hypothetical protein
MQGSGGPRCDASLSRKYLIQKKDWQSGSSSKHKLQYHQNKKKVNKLECLFWTESCYIAQADLELMIFPPSAPSAGITRVVYLSVVELLEFFVYSGNRFLSDKCFVNVSLLFCGSDDRTKVLNFGEVQFIFLLFVCAFDIIPLKKHCLIQGHKDFSPTFFLRVL